MTQKKRLYGWALLVGFTVLFAMFELNNAFGTFYFVVFYSAGMGIGVGLIAPDHCQLDRRVVHSLLVAVLVTLLASLTLVSANAIVFGIDQVYGFVLPWFALAAYLGFGLLPAAIMVAAVQKPTTE